MNIGELFVNLGIKGGDKTLGTLSDTNKGMKSIASTSLEAKAAIIGAMYALQRLFSTSGQTGTNLTNFSALLGTDMVQTLQKYQYAARQVGITNQSVEGSFKALQGAMTKTLMGEGAPKGLARVAMLTGEMTPADIAEYAKRPEKLLQKLQEYAQKEKNGGLKNEVLKSFGLGDDMIAGLSRNAFRPEVLAKAPTYSDKEVEQLDKANIAWSNLANKIEMAFGRFNAKHGGALVTDISKIVDQVVKLSEAFVTLAEKTALFENLTKVFIGWGYIFETIGKGVDALNSLDLEGNAPAGEVAARALPGGAESDKKPIGERIGNAFLGGGQGESLMGILWDVLVDKASENKNVKSGIDKIKDVQAPFPNRSPDGFPGAAAVAPPVSGTAGNTSTQNVEVNQNFNFQHEGKDPKRVADHSKKAIQDAFRQIPQGGI